MTTTESDDVRNPGYGRGREALIQAAIRVVGAKGLRHLTYRAVATEAGVTHGLVAHHFGTRETLITEAMRYAVARSVSDTLAPASAQGSVASGDFAVSLADLVAGDPELQAFQFELVLEARRNPELLPMAQELYATYREATASGLAAQGITDPLVADLVFAALDGLVFQQVTLRGPEATRAAVARLNELLAGLSPDQFPASGA